MVRVVKMLSCCFDSLNDIGIDSTIHNNFIFTQLNGSDETTLHKKM